MRNKRTVISGPSFTTADHDSNQPEISGKNYNFPITCHIGVFYLCFLFQLELSYKYIQPVCTALQYKLYENMPGIKSKQLLEKIIVLNSAPRCMTRIFISISCRDFGTMRTHQI